MATMVVFALLAAVAAIYAVLPTHRQLRIRYVLFSRLPLAFLAVAFASIIVTYGIGSYLQAPSRTSVGQVTTDFGTIVLDTPAIELIQLAAAVSIMLLLLWVFAAPSVPIRNEKQLLNVLRTCYNREDYATLTDVIGENYSPLIDMPPEPTPPRPQNALQALRQAYEQAEDESGHDSSKEQSEETPSRDGQLAEADDEVGAKPVRARLPRVDLYSRMPDRLSSISSAARERLADGRYRIAMWRYQRSQQAEAVAYTETLLTDPEYGKRHPLVAPELGIRIIEDESLDSFPRAAFVDMYLRTLLESNNSLLYHELRRNQTIASGYLDRYRIEPDNRLLQALFADCEVTESVNAYKSIGDRTRELLREQGRKDHDRYTGQHLTNVEHAEDYVFTDPIYVAIHFFDVLVREAFYQQMTWHMWLYYYESFTRDICANYELTAESDPDAEWPNDYSRLLYQMVQNMTDWLRILQQLADDHEQEPDACAGKSETDTATAGQQAADDEATNDERYGDAEFIGLETIDTTRGGNIPKSTVICLISCHKEILTTNSIPSKFKSYITEIVLKTCLDLYQYESDSLPRRYGELMLHCIEEEISGPYGSDHYRQELRRAYRTQGRDPGVRHEISVKDYERSGLVDDLDDLLGYSPTSAPTGQVSNSTHN